MLWFLVIFSPNDLLLGAEVHKHLSYFHLLHCYLFICNLLFHYACQPPQRDVTMSLPKPSPASMVDTCTSNKKDDENDEDEQEEVGFSG